MICAPQMALPQGLGFYDKVTDGTREDAGLVICVGCVGVVDAAVGELGTEKGADVWCWG